MSLTARFAEYAAAFEKAYASDEWEPVGEFFHEDAVYEAGLSDLLGGRIEGRRAILDYFKQVLDRFDRRFESRTLNLLEGPREEDDSVWIRGTATYAAPGIPDLVLELEETVVFDGDRIRTLRDEYTPEMEKELTGYLTAHAEGLGIEVPS